jgi:hypothetical protein
MRRLWLLPAAALAAGVLTAPAAQATGDHHTVRFATFNASLNRGAAGQLVTDLSTPDNAQAREVAEVIQRNRPDVMLINEFDYAPPPSTCSATTTSSAARTAPGPSTSRTRSSPRPIQVY